MFHWRLVILLVSVLLGSLIQIGDGLKEDEKSFVGVLVADRGKIRLFRDLDGDGTANGWDNGETTVYWIRNNFKKIVALHVNKKNYIFAGEEKTKSVYRMKETTDAGIIDDNKVTTWFSEFHNFYGHKLTSPTGIYENDNAVYIMTGGVVDEKTKKVLINSKCLVYRTVDTNGDGDANDEGEATIWMDVEAVLRHLIPDIAEPTTKPIPYHLIFMDDTAYILMDATGDDWGLLLAAKDKNGNGKIDIDEDEAHVVMHVENKHSVNIFKALTADEKTKSLYVSGYQVHDFTIAKLVMKDAFTVDKVEHVWDDKQAEIRKFFTSPAHAMMETTDGKYEFFILSIGFITPNANNIFRLTDNDGDGKFLSKFETVLWKNRTNVYKPNDIQLYYEYPEEDTIKEEL